MKRAPLRRGLKPLRAGPGPSQRTPFMRGTPLRPGAWRKPGNHGPGTERSAFAASDAQRAKMLGAACIVCLQTKGITAAHLAARSLGGCDHADCVVPLCWMHHRAYDSGRLDLLPHLEPRWRTEVAHAVMHLGLVGRRVSAAWPPAGRASADRRPAAGMRRRGVERAGDREVVRGPLRWPRVRVRSSRAPKHPSRKRHARN